MNNSTIGVFGLGVMGKSLSLNLLEKGYAVSVFNRIEGDESDVVENFISQNKTQIKLKGFTDLSKFIESLERPRKILLMIKAGLVVDLVLEQLVSLLDEKDIIIDGGNSYFKDSNRRCKFLKNKNIEFIGSGFSGGEEGARKGPSIMPGGDKNTYDLVAQILENIAAKDEKGNPCCAYIGPEGSGHFIKMVHNGIEYAEMQLLAELYAIMSKFMTYHEISEIFTHWNKGDLYSYLLEITADIFIKKEGNHYLLDLILDKAGNKGTGSWSSKTALDLGTPNTMMSSAVFARYISSLKDKRKELSDITDVKPKKNSKIDVIFLKNAYSFARIINHHQGFELIKQASRTFDWDLSLSEIARIWTNGCIIKSAFMTNLVAVFQENAALIQSKNIYTELLKTEKSVSKILDHGLRNRIPLSTFSAAYNYWIAMTTDKLPANLIQAQRDYFGAHTYQRVDAPLNEFFHTNWQ